VGGIGTGRKETDPWEILRPGGERNGKPIGQRGQQEAAAVHAGMVGRTPITSQPRRLVLRKLNSIP
jgi:hypothetical protein